MGPKTIQLITVLEQIIAILDRDGEKHWRKWIESARSRLLNSDYSGIEHLLDAYGGMGSFNDLVIGQCMEIRTYSICLEFLKRGQNRR